MKKRKFILAAFLLSLFVIAGLYYYQTILMATEMHLAEYEGSVAVVNSRKNEVRLKEQLPLYSGYTVNTRSDGIARILLDDTKLVLLSADGQAEIESTKDGKHLTITADPAELFFAVTEKLENDETLHFKNRNSMISIRGTVGFYRQTADNESQLAVLEGAIDFSDLNQTVTKTITTGQIADLIIQPDGSVDITVRQILSGDIPVFVSDELTQNEEVVQQIEANGGIIEYPEKLDFSYEDLRVFAFTDTNEEALCEMHVNGDGGFSSILRNSSGTGEDKIEGKFGFLEKVEEGVYKTVIEKIEMEDGAGDEDLDGQEAYRLSGLQKGHEVYILLESCSHNNRKQFLSKTAYDLYCKENYWDNNGYDSREYNGLILYDKDSEKVFLGYNVLNYENLHLFYSQGEIRLQKTEVSTLEECYRMYNSESNLIDEVYDTLLKAVPEKDINTIIDNQNAWKQKVQENLAQHNASAIEEINDFNIVFQIFEQAEEHLESLWKLLDEYDKYYEQIFEENTANTDTGTDIIKNGQYICEMDESKVILSYGSEKILRYTDANTDSEGYQFLLKLSGAEKTENNLYKAKVKSFIPIYEKDPSGYEYNSKNLEYSIDVGDTLQFYTEGFNCEKNLSSELKETWKELLGIKKLPSVLESPLIYNVTQNTIFYCYEDYKSAAELDAEKEYTDFSFLKHSGFEYTTYTNWGDYIRINTDGSFDGKYSGGVDNSRSNQNTMYRFYHTYTGKFSKLEKVSDLIYKATVESLVLDYPPGTENVDHDLSEEYGKVVINVSLDLAYLKEGDEVYFYLEGFDLNELSENDQENVKIHPVYRFEEGSKISSILMYNGQYPFANVDY